MVCLGVHTSENTLYKGDKDNNNNNNNNVICILVYGADSTGKWSVTKTAQTDVHKAQ